ncbi:MAG: hypothetical protein OXE56_10730 [Gammaproteobacteria bacterium]|nr:hypothetical protein [Gammaproteobacteria bacterium]
MPTTASKTTVALKHARRKAIKRLQYLVRPDGAWPSICIDSSGQTSQEFPPFTAAQGSLALMSLKLPDAIELRTRTQQYIQQICEYPGLWRYWQKLPPDLDDTSVCSIVSRTHPWIILGLNIQRILGQRDEHGLFRTWMVTSPDFKVEWNTLDPVVNANVVAYLGDHKWTQPAQRWIEQLIIDEREADALVFYRQPMDLYLALARAIWLVPPAFCLLETILVERIFSLLKIELASGHAMRVAQGIVALDLLGETFESSFRNRIVVQLLESQSPQGGWAGLDIWTRSPESPGSFQSEALATALCADAIERLIQQIQ